MKTERISIVDLGTNTFHLLIADLDGINMDTVYSEKISVRIGKGGINHGFIPEDGCERAVLAMKFFREKIEEFQSEKVFATATSAFRNAKNGRALSERIKAESDIDIDIISGDLEAELIYYGVKEAIELGKEKSLIVDIGGGSVEFILANKDGIFWKESFEIGGQRLMDLFHKNDPISTEEIAEINHYLSTKLESLSAALAEFPTDVLIGASGSFETLSDMDLRRKGFDFSIETKKEYAIPLTDFYHLYLDIIVKDRASRMEIPGMIELRVDMMVVAAVLIKYILECYGMKQLRVSTYALKEGVLSRIMKGESLIANQ